MKKILLNIFGLLISNLPVEVVKRATDAFLDIVEDAVKKTENKIDDSFVLPICALIRKAFDVPDND